MNIIANSSATLNQCINYTNSIKNANKLCKELVPIIYEESIVRGIDPAISIAQAYKETGYFNFGGVIDASYHNVCGLKIPQGGGDKDPEAHKKFNNWTDGINAFLDHLALYAGASGYPKYSEELEKYYKEKGIKYDSVNLKKKGTTEDPRHFTYLYGKCKTVESLSGNWAPSSSYGKDIIDISNKIREASNEEATSEKEGLKILSNIKSLLLDLEKYII